MAGLVDVGALADLPDRVPHAVTLPDGTAVCLVRRGEAVSAFLDECPHQGMPLSAGEVLDDDTIECPWHGARFDCASGAVRRGPAEEDATALAVSVVGGRVLVTQLDR